MIRWFHPIIGLLAAAMLLAGLALWLRSRPQPFARLSISKRTTHLLGPMRGDGTVDFAAHYAPARDTMHDWNQAGTLAHEAPKEWPAPQEAFATLCARSQGSQSLIAWVRASRPALQKLELAAKGDWPETAPWMRATVQMVARKSRADPALAPGSFRWFRPRLNALRALACRCAQEVSVEPAQALGTISTLARLASSAARTPDDTVSLLAHAAAREAVACAEQLDKTDARSLLARLEVPEGVDSREIVAWFNEQQRLRMLDIAVDAFYRFNQRPDLDINTLLATINEQYNYAGDHGGEFDEQSFSAAHARLRAALINPFTTADELRRVKSQWTAELVRTVIGPSDVKRRRKHEVERLRSEDTLRRLVQNARLLRQP